jgi:hypothetical protein
LGSGVVQVEASDVLLTIAEMAIGLAGFSGVILAFTYHGRLSPTDRYRFIGLFTQALTVALLCLVPFGFHYADQVGAAIWRGSSAVAVVFWLFSAWLTRVRLFPEFSPEEQLPKYGEGTIWTLGIINLLLQLANLIGWPIAPGPLFYLAGLVLWFAVAAFFFATLVLYRRRE